MTAAGRRTRVWSAALGGFLRGRTWRACVARAFSWLCCAWFPGRHGRGCVVTANAGAGIGMKPGRRGVKRSWTMPPSQRRRRARPWPRREDYGTYAMREFSTVAAEE